MCHPFVELDRFAVSGVPSASGRARQKQKMSRHPRRIDRYDIVYQIASGGMASVYVGHLSGPAGFEKLVAIKVIHPHLAEETALIDMFLDEARHSARLHHPNVGEVLEVGDEDGLYYMVSELILGQNLQEVAERARKKGRRLSQYQVAHIMHEAARGLDAAHRLTDSDGSPLNLVHRDVCPRNVLVSYEGQVKLIDFGVAWAKNKTSRTVAGAVKGTTAYLAPELIRGQSPDPRSDIFSVGIVLYELVTGLHPFPAESEAHRLHTILTSKITPPSTYYPDIDPELENIIMRSLSRNKEERFESAQRLCDSLASVCEKSDARIGASILSDIMQKIFAEEIVEHEARVRAFKAQSGPNAGVFEPPKDEQLREDSLLPPLDSETPPKPTGAAYEIGPRRDTPIGRIRAFSIRTKALIAATALVALLAAVFGVTGTNGAQTNEKPPPKTSEAAVVSHSESPSDYNDDDATNADEAMSTVGLTFDVSPPDASVSVNGGPMMSTQGELYLLEDGAEHLLTFTAPGHEPHEIRIKAEGDRHLVVTLDPEKPSIESDSPPKPRTPTRRTPKKAVEAGNNQKTNHIKKRSSTKNSKKDDDLLNNPYD